MDKKTKEIKIKNKDKNKKNNKERNKWIIYKESFKNYRTWCIAFIILTLYWLIFVTMGLIFIFVYSAINIGISLISLGIAFMSLTAILWFEVIKQRIDFLKSKNKIKKHMKDFIDLHKTSNNFAEKKTLEELEKNKEKVSKKKFWEVYLSFLFDSKGIQNFNKVFYRIPYLKKEINIFLRFNFENNSEVKESMEEIKHFITLLQKSVNQEYSFDWERGSYFTIEKIFMNIKENQTYLIKEKRNIINNFKNKEFWDKMRCYLDLDNIHLLFEGELAKEAIEAKMNFIFRDTEIKISALHEWNTLVMYFEETLKVWNKC